MILMCFCASVLIQLSAFMLLHDTYSWMIDSVVLDLQPRPHYVSTPGSRVTFTCQSLFGAELVSLQWLVNGTLLESLNLRNVTAIIGDSYGILMFMDIPVAYNSTTITCAATFNSAMSQVTDTRDSLLIVQSNFCVCACQVIFIQYSTAPKSPLLNSLAQLFW